MRQRRGEIRKSLNANGLPSVTVTRTLGLKISTAAFITSIGDNFAALSFLNTISNYCSRCSCSISPYCRTSRSKTANAQTLRGPSLGATANPLNPLESPHSRNQNAQTACRKWTRRQHGTCKFVILLEVTVLIFIECCHGCSWGAMVLLPSRPKVLESWPSKDPTCGPELPWET